MAIYPGVVSGTVHADGLKVGYHVGGKQDFSETIVLVHGTGGRTETHFFTLYPMLATRYRVIGVDLADKSGDGAPLSVEGLMRQVIAVLDSLVPEQHVVLVGYSLGACVVSALAAEFPERVSALVLLNGWAATDNSLRLRLKLWRRLYEQGNLEALAEYMLATVHSRGYLNARTWAEIKQLLSSYLVGPGSSPMMELNTRMDITSRLSTIRASTLVVGSTLDQLIPVDHSLELFGAIESARYVEIGGGHASVTERPAELFHLIHSFVRDPAAHPAGTVLGDEVLQQLNRF